MVITSSSSVPCSTVFDIGKHKTKLVKVEPQTCTKQNSPPKAILIGTPSEAGKFPVLIFLHGYFLLNSFYSQLIQHLSSHGFIVVAPQDSLLLSLWKGADATEDIKSTAEITNWLAEGLQHYLPPEVEPNLKKLGLAGHSRGGKVAFALALGKLANISTGLKFSALIGVDPVDGMDKGKQIPPSVLTYIPHSFSNLDMPVMVIGSGLGEIEKHPFFPVCAPKGVNHRDFYNECCKPACYFVAKDYGHIDMLDDETGPLDWAANFLCKNGKSREPMRRFVGGVLVAFLEAYLEGNSSKLIAIRNGHVTLPVELQHTDFRL